MANNVKMSVKDKNLTIEIDLSKRLGRSKSGKSVMVASTEGIIDVPSSDVKIGINAFVADK